MHLIYSSFESVWRMPGDVAFAEASSLGLDRVRLVGNDQLPFCPRACFGDRPEMALNHAGITPNLGSR